MSCRELTRSNAIRAAALLAVVVLLGINLLFAELELFEAANRRATPGPGSIYRLPSARALSAASLNYRRFAADIVWVRGLVYYGQIARMRRQTSHLKRYAHTVSRLDPYFYDVYRWFADINITENIPVSGQILEESNQFLERGMRYFPRACDLPHSAALNYIGYSTHASAKRRLRESRRAIAYLKRTAACPDAPSNTTALLAYFYRRAQKLRAQIDRDPSADDKTDGSDVSLSDKSLSDQSLSDESLSSKQVSFYTQLYLTASKPSVRQRIVEILRRHGVDDSAVLAQSRAYDTQLRRQRSTQLGYLPIDLWTLIAQTDRSQTDRSQTDRSQTDRSQTDRSQTDATP